MILFYFQGFGMLLMEEAERIAREEHGSSKIAVISGVLCTITQLSYFTHILYDFINLVNLTEQ